MTRKRQVQYLMKLLFHLRIYTLLLTSTYPILVFSSLLTYQHFPLHLLQMSLFSQDLLKPTYLASTIFLILIVAHLPPEYATLFHQNPLFWCTPHLLTPQHFPQYQLSTGSYD